MIQGSFQLAPGQLDNLFSSKSINSGYSMQRLNELGGAEGISKSLKTDLNSGLDGNDDREQRIKHFGRNVTLSTPPKGLFSIFLEILKNNNARLLCLASFSSVLLRILFPHTQFTWKNDWIIMVLITIFTIIFTTIMRVKQLSSLTTYSESKLFYQPIKAIRNGKIQTIRSPDIVVGDIIEISQGDVVPAYGILLEGSVQLYRDLQIQRIEVTSPFLISFEIIRKGNGRILILALNRQSQKTKPKQRNSNFEKNLATRLLEIQKMSRKVSVLATNMFSIVYIGRFALNSQGGLLQKLLNLIYLGVSLVMVSKIQGIDLAKALGLYFSVNRMKDQNLLISELDACSSLGQMTSICTAKTGTLTKNKLVVCRVYTQGRQYQHVGKLQSSLNLKTKNKISLVSLLNGHDKLQNNQHMHLRGTKGALIELAERFNNNYTSIDGNNILKSQYDDKTKTKLVIYKQAEKTYVCTTGIPSYLIKYATSYINSEAQISKIDEPFLKDFQRVQQEFNDNCGKTLLLCYKEISEVSDKSDELSDLIIVGLVGFQDPLKSNIKQAVSNFQSLGINIRVTTGENKTSSILHGKQAGILAIDWEQNENTKYQVIDGESFRQLVGGVEQNQNGSLSVGNLEVFKQFQSKLKILYRSTPLDKMILVVGLRELGEIVAVTGEGIGDVRTFREADIAFSMGMTGTQSSHMSADIIVLDDSFVSITRSVNFGLKYIRTVTTYLQFELTFNIATGIVSLISLLIIQKPAIRIVEGLFLHLILIPLAVLHISTLNIRNRYKEKIFKQSTTILTPKTVKRIITHGIFQAVVLTFIFLASRNVYSNKEEQQSIFFNIFALTQILNCITYKMNVRNICLNCIQQIGVIVISLLVLIIFAWIFGTASIGFKQIGICLLVAIMVTIINLAFKSVYQYYQQINLKDKGSIKKQQ